jgi:DNA primase catalytic subunit
MRRPADYAALGALPRGFAAWLEEDAHTRRLSENERRSLLKFLDGERRSHSLGRAPPATSWLLASSARARRSLMPDSLASAANRSR